MYDEEVVPPTEEGHRRSGMAAATVDGKIYVLGGHNGDTALKLLEEFEPGQDLSSRGTWQRLPKMQARRAHCAGCALNDMIYAIGGSADGRTLSTFEVFDPARGEWALWFTKPPMHSKRTMHAAAVCDGRLFVCGGTEGVRDLNLVEELDVASNSWIIRDKMISGRSYFALAAAASSLYAIGGQDRRKDTGPRAHVMVERFDLYSERWSEVATLLHGRVGSGAAALECPDEDAASASGLAEFVFAVGGSDGDAVLASVERYDPRKNLWVEAPPMSIGRVGHAVAVVDNRLYAIGGFDGREPLDTFECFDPVANQWGPPLRMGSSCSEEADYLPPGSRESVTRP